MESKSYEQFQHYLNSVYDTLTNSSDDRQIIAFELCRLYLKEAIQYVTVQLNMFAKNRDKVLEQIKELDEFVSSRDSIERKEYRKKLYGFFIETVHDMWNDSGLETYHVDSGDDINELVISFKNWIDDLDAERFSYFALQIILDRLNAFSASNQIELENKTLMNNYYSSLSMLKDKIKAIEQYENGEIDLRDLATKLRIRTFERDFRDTLVELTEHFFGALYESDEINTNTIYNLD